MIYIDTDDSSDDLEAFFNALKSFNHGHPLNRDFQTKVIEYFKTRHIFNKNNFLEKPDDLKTYNQLPLEIKNVIYTGFVYRNFLREFHRFFQFHKSACDQNYCVQSK